MYISEVHKFHLFQDPLDALKKYADVPKLWLDTPIWSSIFLTLQEQTVVYRKASVMLEKYYKKKSKKIEKPNKYPLQHIFEDVVYAGLPRFWYTTFKLQNIFYFICTYAVSSLRIIINT